MNILGQRSAAITVGLVWMMTLLLSACGDSEVNVTPSAHFSLTSNPVLAADLSKDSMISALITSDQKVKVWSNQQPKQVFRQWDQSQLGGEVFQLALSGNRRFLAVAGYWTVTMLNVDDGSVVTSWDVQGFVASATVEVLRINDNGSKVLVGMSDGAVLSVDLTSTKALKLDHHKLAITRLSFHDNDQYVLSGSKDKVLAYWHTQTGEIVHQQSFRSRLTTLAIDGNNRAFVSDALSSHWFIDVKSGEKRTELNYFERFRYFRQALFLDQGKHLVTSSPKQMLTLWDSQSGEEIRSWPIGATDPNETIAAMAVNKQGLLVTLSTQGMVETWNYGTFL